MGEIWAQLTSRYFVLDSAIRNGSPRWHDRAWVMQEYILAPEIYVCFGGYRFCLGHYHTLYLDVTQLITELPMFNAWRLITHELDTQSVAMQMTEAMPGNPNGAGLFESIRWLNHTKATDPRDKVYSMLGFMYFKEAQYLKPDYNLQCWQVFAKATFASINARKAFDIL